jgi:hypothetical protein
LRIGSAPELLDPRADPRESTVDQRIAAHVTGT